MKEAIEVTPVPIVDIGGIDVESKLSQMRTMDAGLAGRKKKSMIHKGASSHRKHRTLVGVGTIDNVSVISRKISVVADSDGDRLSRNDSDDNKSVKSKKSVSVYSSVAKSIRTVVNKKMNSTAGASKRDKRTTNRSDLSAAP